MPDNVKDNPVEKRKPCSPTVSGCIRVTGSGSRREGTDMDGYTLSISRCSGGDGVEESFKAKIKRREAALDAFAVAEAYCKESWMVSRCEREGFDGFIIDLCSDAEDETIRLVRLVPDSEDGIMDDVFRLEYGSCEYKV